MRGSQACTEAKDIGDAGLHLAIRVLTNRAIVAADIADGQRAAQGAPARFIPAPLMETAAQREELCLNWLRVLDTTECSQVDQRVGHQLHRIVSLLDAFKAEQQPLELIFPRESPLDPHA
jgi:hypothetical protein